MSAGRRAVLCTGLAAMSLAACGGVPVRPSGVATSPVSPGTSAGVAPSMPETSARPVETGSPAVPATSRPNSSGDASALPAALAGAELTRLPTSAHVVALTFDAGGNDAGVAAILRTLSADGVPATFFLTGRWCELYPQEAATIAAQHDVGDHTYSHPHLTQLGDASVRDEVLHGAQVIRSSTGHDPRPLFRFPYGDSDSRTLGDVHALGYGAVRWTVDTLGWEGGGAGQSVDSVVARVLAAASPGEIVLMHVGAAQDGSTLDADALARVIAGLRTRGYGFTTVLDSLG